ncbi:MAG: hydroxyacid dehydrogenase [Thermodesulfobacteriota bacterium]
MAVKFKVLMYEPMHRQGTKLLESRCELVYAQSFDEAHLISLAEDVDALVIRANGAVTAALLEAAPRLKVIGRHGVGLDGIDLAAAKQRGVMVVYTPTANTQSVAEHFVGLAITLAKKLRSADQALRAGRWQARYELIGSELMGKILGVLGFGRIGQQTARICHLGFNMPVIYYDVVAGPQAEAELGAQRVEMAEVFKQADFISINLPLLPATQGCINAAMLALMKPSAFLLNMARGPIWNEADVYQALAAGRIAGVGADVYAQEPASADNPLFKLDSFVGSPHMSAHTDEAMIKMSLVARDVLAVLEGNKPQFPVPGFA